MLYKVDQKYYIIVANKVYDTERISYWGQEMFSPLEEVTLKENIKKQLNKGEKLIVAVPSANYYIKELSRPINFGELAQQAKSKLIVKPPQETKKIVSLI